MVFDMGRGGDGKNYFMNDGENLLGVRSGGQRLVLVGGFLGAGKTTIISGLTQWLEKQGRKVGLVTNDQGQGLMDTATAQMAIQQAIGADGKKETQVEEITGGCFCCKLDDLVGAIQRLDAATRPDVIVAEPVGSCTDLMATVLLPLEQIYEMPFSPTPYTVVLDARRALAALGGKRNTRDFHRDVGYIFRKQIEEAEWLAVNKVDLLEPADLDDLRERLTQAYPAKRVFFISAKTGTGLDEWFTTLMASHSAPQEIMEVDYERYAEGEAMLGWVNSEAICQKVDESSRLLDWGAWLQDCGEKIAERLDQVGAEVGHFKMSVVAGNRRWRLHQVMSGTAPTLHEDVLDSASHPEVKLLVNLRAEGIAEQLEAIVDEVLTAQNEVVVKFVDKAAFQPGKPQPTHRMASVG